MKLESFELGKAGMHVSIQLTFTSEQGMRVVLNKREEPEIIVLEEAIKNGAPIMKNGVPMTSNIIGLRDLNLNFFELETRTAFYKLQFLS